MTLTMGTPVGQQINSADTSKTLRWNEGRWGGMTNPPVSARIESTVKPSVLFLTSARRTMYAAKQYVRCHAYGAAGLVAFLVAGLYGWNVGFTADSLLPLAPVKALPEPAKSVTTVDAPYPLPPVAAEPPLEAPVAAEPTEANPVVPIVPARAPAANVAITQVKAQPAKQAPDVPANKTAPVQPPAKASQGQATPDNSAAKDADASKEQKHPAVILDTDPSSKAKSVSSGPGVAAPTNQNGIVQTQLPKPKVDSAATPKMSSGLVALTPDGKYALFTNVKTRLPEKFGIGEKLPSGETVKSIDKTNGKVKTDAGEYKLE